MLNTMLIIGAVIGIPQLIFILGLCRVAQRADQRLYEQDPQLVGNVARLRSEVYGDWSIREGGEQGVRP